MKAIFTRALCFLTAAALCLGLHAQAEELSPEAILDPPSQDQEPVPTALPYGDVSQEDWFYPALCWCQEAHLLQGIPFSGAFESQQPVTRAMFTTMLAHLLEPDLTWEGSTVYSDVSPDSYYYTAVSWAAAKQWASGYSDGTFHPGTLLSRQQMAVLLAAAARYLGYDATPTASLPFAACSDAASVSAQDRKDVKWCMQQGFLSGTADGKIAPKDTVSRGQAVEVLQRFGTWLASPDAAPQISSVPPSAPVEHTASHSSMQAAIARIASKYGANGVCAAYVRDGHVVDTYAYGAAVKGSLEMTADTKLRVASISKVMVGLAAQLAAQNGTLQLDSDIGNALGVKIHTLHSGDVVTPRSILTHSSSLTVAAEGTPCDIASVRQRLSSTSATRNVISGNLGNWAYNNYAFSVLGMAVELAEQRTLDEILYEKLYGPLHIDAAFYTGDISRTDLLAEIYRANGTVGLSQAAQAQRTSDGIPGSDGTTFAGGLTISTYDLGKLVALLANDGIYEGVAYLPAEVVAALEAHQSTMISGGFYQGQPLRYRTWTYGQSELYYHTGSAYGVYNLISYNPAAKTGVVVLTSGASGAKDTSGIYAICGEISQLLYHQAL